MPKEADPRFLKTQGLYQLVPLRSQCLQGDCCVLDAVLGLDIIRQAQRKAFLVAVSLPWKVGVQGMFSRHHLNTILLSNSLLTYLFPSLREKTCILLYHNILSGTW